MDGGDERLPDGPQTPPPASPARLEPQTKGAKVPAYPGRRNKNEGPRIRACS
jgi:hypothetical protein